MNSYIIDCKEAGIVTDNGNPNDEGVGYTRYSSLNQTENSTEYQIEEIVKYCKRRNIRLCKIYIDEACTGTNDKRASFQAMIADAQNDPSWNQIIVFDYTRYSRSVFDALNYLRIFQDNDIELISATEDFGSGDPAFLMRMFTFATSDLYSQGNSRRTFSGMLVKANKNSHCGGTPPLGYDLIDRSLQINEREAEAVRLIFDMYELNYSYSKIADTLNERGYRTKAGTLFKKQSFYLILRQEKYVGTYIWNKAAKENSYGKRNSHKYKPVEEQIRIENAIPAIISLEQFLRVQAKILKDDKTEVSTKHHYMLSGMGIIKCAECGANMIGNVKSSHSKIYHTYACPNHKKKTCTMKEIRVDELDKFVAGNLVSDLYNRKDLNEVFKAMFYDERYKLLKDNLRGKEKAIRNTLKALESGCTSTISAKLREIDKSKKTLEKQLSVYEENAEAMSSVDLKELATKFGNLLRTSEEPEIKTFLKANIESIIIGHEDVSVTFDVA